MNNSYPAVNLDWSDFARQTFSEINAERPEFDQDAPLKTLADAYEAEVPVATLREIMIELWDFFNALTIHRRRDSLALLGVAWLSITFRNAFSTFALIDEGLVDTSPATARAALEHSIYVSLFAGSENRYRIAERMESLHAKHMNEAYEAASSPEGLEEFFNIVLEGFASTEIDQELSWSAKVEQVCKHHLLTGEVIYSHYRVLSRMMHVGMMSAQPYFFQLANDDQKFSFIPAVNPSNETSLVSVASCAWAGWAIDEILGEPIFAGVLRPIAEQLELTPLFVPSSHTTQGKSYEPRRDC